jgi:HK97 family phage major capsid protein
MKEQVNQVKTKQQLDAEAAELDRLLAEAVSTKNYDGLADLERRVSALAADRSDLERKEATQRDPVFAALRESGGDLGTQPDHTIVGKTLTGAQANPLWFDQKALQTLHKSLTTGQGVSVKAFSTVDSLIPAQLDPNILPKIHENRLLDYLPVQSISAPSYEIIIHNSTTGAPTPVAEGAAKPELVLNTTPLTLTAIKLACHVGISHESLQDFANFQDYAQVEAMRQLQDVENAQLLSGSGTGGNMSLNGFA